MIFKIIGSSPVVAIITIPDYLYNIVLYVKQNSSSIKYEINVST